MKAAQRQGCADRAERQSMLELLRLLRLLRTAGFRTVIVSGGDTEFLRPWSEAMDGIPPEQVIGSRLSLTWTQVSGASPRLLRLPVFEVVTDGPNKPIAIQHGWAAGPWPPSATPTATCKMLEWATSGDGPRLGLLVHHTDARREWAYDRASKVGPLDRALDRARERGWIVLDMARDWPRVYPSQPKRP